MAVITDWYGRNSIGWGKTYEVSHAGNLNESNGWGKFYPFTVLSSIFEVSTTSVTADNSIYTADQTEY